MKPETPKQAQVTVLRGVAEGLRQAMSEMEPELLPGIRFAVFVLDSAAARIELREA